ncbi:MAG: DUF4271 domain-containing protein [Muribaculaceae bacterium]|nr:DUF4271 domain-containing protein [Muribaculaceae bacterium]
MVSQGGLALTADTVAAADTLGADSLAAADRSGMELTYGLRLEAPAERPAVPVGEGSAGMSWILTGVVLLFLVACLRYRQNSRYLSLIIHDMLEVRERHNAFDDTLRETTFVWLLNILWCCLAGVMVYGLMSGGLPGAIGALDAGRIGICIGMAAAYTVFLSLAYTVMGNLFSDGPKASLWVKGHLSTQGLEAILFFPVAMIALCVPAIAPAMLTVGVIIFILAKILFIYKGFCIFFANPAGWVLFLYYLCSLEIVPIVITYVAVRQLCWPAGA